MEEEGEGVWSEEEEGRSGEECGGEGEGEGDGEGEGVEALDGLRVLAVVEAVAAVGGG